MKVFLVNKDNVSDMLPLINNNECFIKFWMEHCGHCEAMAPEWNKMKHEIMKNNGSSMENSAIVEIDAPASSKIPIGRTIMGFPTIMHTRNGKEVSRYEGPPTHLAIIL